ncbi:MAG: DoxX family protein [Schleiferiaceae bacterium]|jgi:hypothetical protein|nr:DoxX family protein [Schleiferiaceae bacterium]
MEKRDRIIYFTVTGLFSVLILMGVSQYFFNYEMVAEMFTNIKFPTYLIYGMGVAKLLGVLAIWFSKSDLVKEWAYAGFVFNMILAISAHVNVGDGEFLGSLLALILVITSYVFFRKRRNDNRKVAIA